MKLIFILIIYLLGISRIHAQYEDCFELYSDSILGWNYSGKVSYNLISRNKCPDTIFINKATFSGSQSLCDIPLQGVNIPPQYYYILNCEYLNEELIESDSLYNYLVNKDRRFSSYNLNIDWLNRNSKELNQIKISGLFQLQNCRNEKIQNNLFFIDKSKNGKNLKSDPGIYFKIISDSLVGNFYVDKSKKGGFVSVKFIIQNISNRLLILDSIQLDNKKIHKVELLNPGWATVAKFHFQTNDHKYFSNELNTYVKLFYRMPNGEPFYCIKKINFKK